MQDPEYASADNLFQPSPHLSDSINRNIVRSEVEGGVYLKDLPEESTLEIETQNRFYTLENRGGGSFLFPAIRSSVPRRPWSRYADPIGAARC